jgi:hypothetical protein
VYKRQSTSSKTSFTKANSNSNSKTGFAQASSSSTGVVKTSFGPASTSSIRGRTSFRTSTPLAGQNQFFTTEKTSFTGRYFFSSKFFLSNWLHKIYFENMFHKKFCVVLDCKNILQAIKCNALKVYLLVIIFLMDSFYLYLLLVCYLQDIIKVINYML